MQEKLLFFRKRSMFIQPLLLFIFIFTMVSAKAANYYWVGGSGSWADLTHWASSSGGAGGAYGSAPSVNDDVIINGASSTGAFTLTFLNSATVRNLTVSGTSGVLTFVMTNTGQNFDIWGDASFQSGMVFTNFLGKIRYFSTPTSLNKVINTNGNTFYGPWKYEFGSNGAAAATVTINGNFTLRNGFEIAATNTYDKIVITGLSNFEAPAAFNPVGSVSAGLNIGNGEVYFDNTFYALVNAYKFYVFPNGKLYSQANGRVFGLYNSGLVNLNYAGTNPTYFINETDINGAATGSVFNFANTIINIEGMWNYGRGTSSNYSIVSSNSHLRFRSTALYFYTKNYTYADVTIEPSSSAGYFWISGNNSSTSSVIPTFDDFVIQRNTYYQMSGVPSTFTFTSNTYKIHPGLTVSSQHANIKIAVNNLCDMLGTCERPIRLMSMNFQFFAGTTIICNNLFTDGISAVDQTGSTPGVPYNPGSSSQVITGGFSGWNFSAGTGRTLVWVGPVPSNTSNPVTYAKWTDPANWRDLSVDPGADNLVTGGPNFVGGTPACPPTFRDSVLFLNNSYVDVDAIHFIYSSGVNFIGAGVINGPTNLEWEIYAGLTFSVNTTNNFMGTVWFRNNKTYECQIITKNVAFRKGVIMNAVNPAGNWRLMDGDMLVPNRDVICTNGWPSTQVDLSFRMTSGHFHTGLTDCNFMNSYKLRVFGLGASGGTMSWYGSDIEIIGYSSYPVFAMLDASNLNCGSSNLKLDFQSTIPGATQLSSLGNKTYYKVSVLSTAGVSTQFSHQLAASPGSPNTTIPTIGELYVDANTYSGIGLSGNGTTAVRVRKAMINAPITYLGYSYAPNNIAIGTFDSLVMNGNVYIYQNLKIRSYVQMAPGKNYVFGTTTQYIDLMAPSSSASYTTCFPITTNYTGATANINGSCAALIRIEKGRFIKNSPHPISGQYLNIVDNTIDVPGTGLNANGVLTGTTTGWSITASVPRKLRWVDPSGVAYNSSTNPSNWNDASRWEQILPSYAPAPQCPPTKIDTIVFDDNSFSSSNQRFAVNTPMEVATMTWENIGSTIPGNTAGIVGSGIISIYGSLKLPPVNQANFMNSSTNNFEFRGVPTVQFPTFTIKTNGQRLRGAALFNSTSNNARWDLQDSLALYANLTLNKGQLYTNGFPMHSVQSGFFVTALNTTDLRTIDITNSKIYAAITAGAGGFWNVTNLGPATNTTVNANGSTIRVSSNGGGGVVFNGGGYIYNNVIMTTGSPAPCVMNITNGDQFGFIDIKAGGSARIQGGPNMIARRIRTNSSNFTLSSTLSIIDSIELLGGANTLLSSNRIRDMFEVASGTTLFAGANEVQWFDNDCPVNLIGISTSNYIQLYSSTAGIPAYLRKDSSTVCADYILMSDIWCVGNGNNPASGCSSYGTPLVLPQTTLCPHANSWIASSCDTISDDNTLCGAWTINTPTRGRAAFTAGSNAVNQGLSCHGWDYRPYPPIPSLQLTAGTPSICIGQSVPLTISGIGKIPFYMDYTDNFGNTYYVNITNAAQLASYNTSTNAFTYSTTVSPTTSTTYSAGVIAIERCFNNISPIGTGSLAVTDNPYPAITNVGAPIEICSGNTGTFVPTTSVPASVTWTSPAVGGISGHSTSGSTNITEALSTSNASPTTITYTLTPSAAGCVGTPVTQDIIVNPLPNAVPGAGQTLDCNNSTVNVSVTSSTPGVNYAWTGPSVVSGGATSSATVDAPGTYSYVVTNPTTGCTRNGSVAVIFAPDITTPTITCPANIAVNTSAVSCNASVVTADPTVNDNCSVSVLRWSMTGATVASSPATGMNYVGTQTFNLGTTTVTYTALDPTGNVSTCSFTVTVTDNVVPVITCPSNMTDFTTVATCSRSLTTTAPTFSDNCGVNRVTWAMTGATTASSPATGVNFVGTQTFNLGVTTVTYTVVDNSGNSATCNFTVTITDNVLPVINCPANIAANTSAASCTASVSSPNPSVSDNCTFSSLTWEITGATSASSPATGINNVGTRIYNLGVSTITYTATDASGNVTTCAYTITVTDNVNPTIVCSSNSTAFTSSSTCTASVATPNPAVSDNCAVASLSWTITQGALIVASGTGNAGTQVFNIGTSTVSYTVTDAAGNSSNCSYTVTVTDNVNPTITCPSAISANTSSTSCDASLTIPAVTFSDNCTVASLTWTMTGATVSASPSSGINQVGTQTFNSGVTTITYTVRDASNNTATCSFTVTVTDATPPVAPVLPDVLGQCSATAPIPVATDNCSGFVNGTTSDPLTYNAQGTFVIHWTFTDAAGNVTTANQTVIVDNSLPPTPPTLATLIGECSVTVPVPSATTGCSGAILGTTTDPLNYTTQGTYTVTWTFDDGMGNVVTAPQTVIVDDITAPVTPTISPVSDECSVSLLAPVAIDNCVGSVSATTANPTSYSAQGTFNVVWNFNDGNGNVTNVIQTVTIADITNPTFSNCPSNISMSNDIGDCGAIVSWTPPIANDNCSGYTVTSSHNPGDFFSLGTTTVTYTVTDIAGNTETCTFDVTVTDTEAPVINGCPPNITVSNDPLLCGAEVMWVIPFPSDNCPGVVFSSTHNSGDFFPTGTTTVTYTATDAYGNVSTCSFDVTVTDSEAPIFADCPTDITVNNDPGICGAVVTWPVMTATDNCSAVVIVGSHNSGDVFAVGTTTVTYTATDADGNSVTCDFNITVVDVEDPVINGLSDISVCEGGAANWNVTATDNCAVQSLTSNYSSGTVFPLGNTWVVYTAVDIHGNTVVDSFAVNVFASGAVNIVSDPLTDICVGDNVILNVVNPVSGATYTWEFGGTTIGTGTPFNLSNIQFNQSGTYNITSDLPGGCISYGSINLAADFCDLLIPEAVTPNSDGDNDTWFIENLENYKNSKVQIVNRWGVVVFESDDYQNDWDGTSQSSLNVGGDQLPEGTFYYVLQIGGDASSKFYGKVFTGYIYLKR